MEDPCCNLKGSWIYPEGRICEDHDARVKADEVVVVVLVEEEEEVEMAVGVAGGGKIDRRH
jgi:hypothetical protein